MKWLVIFLIIFLVGCSSVVEKTSEEPVRTAVRERVTMKLTSLDFEDGGMIPRKFTCDGENINPSLQISDVPAEAKSLVLLMDDPDIPPEITAKMQISVFDHWVLFNIDPGVREIGVAAAPGVKGANSRGESVYTGPCPPPQYEPKVHRYFFKLYAVDGLLDLDGSATKAVVMETMQGHVVASAQLMGRYTRVQENLN